MEPALPASSPSQKRILVVEDDYANRMFFAEYLRFCGYDVLALADGVHLIHHLKTFRPHLLLMDLGLPEISGFELIRRIRSEPHWQTLPIVVTSGYVFDSDLQKAHNLGIQAYLTKPVRLRELTQTIAQFVLLDD